MLRGTSELLPTAVAAPLVSTLCYLIPALCVVSSGKLHATSEGAVADTYVLQDVKGNQAGCDAGPEAVGSSEVGPMWVPWASHVRIDPKQEAATRQAGFLEKLPPPLIKFGHFAW